MEVSWGPLSLVCFILYINLLKYLKSFQKLSLPGHQVRLKSCHLMLHHHPHNQQQQQQQPSLCSSIDRSIKRLRTETFVRIPSLMWSLDSARPMMMLMTTKLDKWMDNAWWKKIYCTWQSETSSISPFNALCARGQVNRLFTSPAAAQKCPPYLLLHLLRVLYWGANCTKFKIPQI